jgi:hypothetical protein
MEISDKLFNLSDVLGNSLVSALYACKYCDFMKISDKLLNWSEKCVYEPVSDISDCNMRSIKSCKFNFLNP